jgi:hypothetical protein
MLDPKKLSDVNSLLIKVGLMDQSTNLVAKQVDLVMPGVWVRKPLFWGKSTLHRDNPGRDATLVAPTRVLVGAWGGQYPPLPENNLLEVSSVNTGVSPIVELQNRITGEKDPCVILCLLVEVLVGEELRYVCVAKQHANVTKGIADLRAVLKLYGVIKGEECQPKEVRRDGGRNDRRDDRRDDRYYDRRDDRYYDRRDDRDYDRRDGGRRGKR